MRSFLAGSLTAGATVALVAGVGSTATAAPFLDFEGYDNTAELVGQNGWVGQDDAASPLLEATTDDGGYVGGTAVGHIGSSGSTRAGRLGLPDLTDVYGIRADFFGGDVGYDDDGISDSVVQINIWNDLNGDSAYDRADEASPVLFGLINSSNGSFRLAGVNSPANWNVDVWYRLTMVWSDEFDDAGTLSRTLELYGEDLTNGVQVNGGNAIVSATIEATAFDFSTWDGVAMRATRGLVDNVEILVVPEPTTVMIAGMGTLVLALRRRRC